MLPSTSQRVPVHTRAASNQRIRRRTAESVARCAAHPETIDLRLGELEREWDIERALEVNGSVLGLAGLLMGITGRRSGFLLAGAVFGFCLQHALSGWCPPIELFRRLGVRTQREIDEERFALKALRGDFEGLPGTFGALGPDAAAEDLLGATRS